ncbi:polyphosphate kinase 1 [Halosegnis marinus]|uniref:Polyphosphate kinase n=1 Tax=Halosegnis marinus TaxID=3034023 RepID=A0ABD5ZLB5_9EURY|nr:polyphosphate kinase 1 [Halosegnis sp. DT85]
MGDEQETADEPGEPDRTRGDEAFVTRGHAADAPATGDLADPSLYLNRELSELEFQERVLYEAVDDRNPLLERVKFLAILTRNLDEFFMKRIGGLKQQMAAGVTETTPDGRGPAEQWELALEKARDLFVRQADCYREEIRGRLEEAGIVVAEYDDLTDAQAASMRDYFETNVLPTLTPLTFDPAHPFPFISNLSLSLGVRTRRDGEDPKFSRVKIPENRPRLVPVEEGSLYVPLERVIEANLDLLFPNVEVLDCAAFRVTRNAEVRRNEEVAEGLIEMIEGVLRDRRFATVVRLEVEARMPDGMRELLADQLDLDARETYERPGPLDFRDFDALADLDRPDLKLPAWTPKRHPAFAGVGEDGEDGNGARTVFDAVADGDVLVHHPYHSFEHTVQSFLETAAHDDDVVAIKAAIYRTSRDSKVIGSLIDAARNGKQVAVMVELKARFDEENNLRWVRRLEEEGIHVAYGTIGLKTHSKTALVVRDEADADGLTLYSHVGTGNYHAETAKSYVDLGLLTDDQDIGHDLTRLFNFFTGHSLNEEYRKLLVAPANLRESFTDLVEREAAAAREGREARIVAKMNSLEDPAMVERLYEASRAGVEIDLLVRGICRLRPGVEGASGNVRVRSVVGRFLEHSRIFRFHNGGDPEYYIGSADWMTRNLDRRVEAVAPIEEPAHREELQFVLDTMLADNRKAWEMAPDGSYTQARPGDDPVVNTHETLMKRAAERAPDGPDEAIYDLGDPLADEDAFDGPE